MANAINGRIIQAFFVTSKSSQKPKDKIKYQRDWMEIVREKISLYLYSRYEWNNILKNNISQ